MAKKNIIWIASFPKSGNTWMRFLLNALMHKKSEITDLNIDGKISGACTSKPMMKDFWGDQPDIGSFYQTRADAFRKLSDSRDEGKKLLMKTHSAYANYKGCPQITPDVSVAGILVVRNPFDTLASCMNHFGFDEDQAFNFLSNLASAINQTDKHYPVLCTNWDGYFKSWLLNAEFPLLSLRYEDLLNKPISQCIRLNKFFNLKVSENDIVDAITGTRFDKLKKIEQDKGFSEASEKSAGFFNRGEANYFSEVLSPRTIDKVLERFGDSMTQMGYRFENGAVVVEDKIPTQRWVPTKKVA